MPVAPQLVMEFHAHLTFVHAGNLSCLILQGSCACCPNTMSSYLHLPSSVWKTPFPWCYLWTLALTIFLFPLLQRSLRGKMCYPSLSCCQSSWTFFPLFSSSKTYLRCEYIVWVVWNSLWISSNSNSAI